MLNILMDANDYRLETQNVLRFKTNTLAANEFKVSPLQRRGQAPNTKQSLRVQMTLEQACPMEYQGAQCAFKDSMIH